MLLRLVVRTWFANATILSEWNISTDTLYEAVEERPYESATERKHIIEPAGNMEEVYERMLAAPRLRAEETV